MQRNPLWEFPRCLNSPFLKISLETNFSHFFRLKCGWLGELSFLSFLFSSNFTTPTLQLMLQQKVHVIFPSLVSKSSPFNWTAVPSDMQGPALIPRATQRHTQGRGLVQLKANIICKKHRSNSWISGTLLSSTLEHFSRYSLQPFSVILQLCE